MRARAWFAAAAFAALASISLSTAAMRTDDPPAGGGGPGPEPLPVDIRAVDSHLVIDPNYEPLYPLYTSESGTVSRFAVRMTWTGANQLRSCGDGTYYRTSSPLRSDLNSCSTVAQCAQTYAGETRPQACVSGKCVAYRRIQIDTSDTTEGHFQLSSMYYPSVTYTYWDTGSCIPPIYNTCNYTTGTCDADWGAYQYVFLFGEQDGDRDFTVDYQVRLTNLDSPHPATPQLKVLPAQNGDDEYETIYVSAAAPNLVTDKMGTTDSMGIWLSCNYDSAATPCAPPGGVTLTVTSPDASIHTVKQRGAAGSPVGSISIPVTWSGPYSPSAAIDVYGFTDRNDPRWLDVGDYWQQLSIQVRPVSTQPIDVLRWTKNGGYGAYHRDIVDENPRVGTCSGGTLVSGGVIDQIIALPGQPGTPRGARMLLDSEGDASSAGFPAGEFLGPLGENHFQGVARTRAKSTILLTADGQGSADLFAGHFAVGASVQGRWCPISGLDRTGELVIDSNDKITNRPPPAYTGHIIDTASWKHAGGLSVFGSFAVVPLESGQQDSKLAFIDITSPARPQRIFRSDGSEYDALMPGCTHSGGAAIVRSNGTYLIAVQGDISADPYYSDIRFYRSANGDIRNMANFTSPAPILGRAYQYDRPNNINFVRQCDGALFLIVTYNDDISTHFFGYNWVEVYRIHDENAPWNMTHLWREIIETRYNSDQYANFAGGAGVYVGRDGTLILYGSEVYRDKGSDTWLRLMEF